MSNAEMWKIVLKETFFSADLLALLIIPVLAGIIAIIVFRRSPLRSTNTWHNVGRRYLTLGCIFVGITFVIYLLAISVAYANKNRDNTAYTERLQIVFRDYYVQKKEYTDRLIDFANRIENTKEIIDEMDNFATNLPHDERTRFGRAWSASTHGGTLINDGAAFDKLMEKLYWPDEKITSYKQENGTIPAIAALRYTEEQIREYKKSNWPKLYPMLDKEQWIYIKNQILTFKDREDALGFLRELADSFQPEPENQPTNELNLLYDRLVAKACPEELQKIECYLEDSPKLLAFYKFSLQNRWWFRTVAIAFIFIIIGVIIIGNGKNIAANGKKKIFK